MENKTTFTNNSLKITKPILFIITLLLLSFNANAQTKKVKAPIIQFEKTVHDYGTINKNSNGDCEFRFKNTGNEPLILSDVIPSCGCTIPDWPKSPIMPGKTAVIKIKFDTNRTGSFSKTITVISNATEDRITLTVKGNIPS